MIKVGFPQLYRIFLNIHTILQCIAISVTYSIRKHSDGNKLNENKKSEGISN